jgi:hypothetical protein
VKAQQAATIARHAVNRAAKLEDIEFLVDTGATRDEIAQRLGYQRLNSLLIFLQRNDRCDLWFAAEPVWHRDSERRAIQAAQIEEGRAKYPRQGVAK